MDDFTASILTLYDNINEMQAKSKLNKDFKILNNYLIEKQYLAYYIYRLWIKYRRIMEYTNTPSEFNKVLTYLNIPPKYFKYDVTFPMQNKMVSNEKQLDLIILNILNQFNKCTKYFTNIKNTKTQNTITQNKITQNTITQNTKAGMSSSSTDTISNNNTNTSKIDLYTEEGQYKQLTNLLKDKSIKIIVNDIQMIKILVPNLSKPSGRISVWEIIKPFINISNNLNNSSPRNTGSGKSPSKPSNSRPGNSRPSNTGSSQLPSKPGNSRPSNTGSSQFQSRPGNSRPTNSYFNPKTSPSGQNVSSQSPSKPSNTGSSQSPSKPSNTGSSQSPSKPSNTGSSQSPSKPSNSRPTNSYFNPKTSQTQPQGNMLQQQSNTV